MPRRRVAERRAVLPDPVYNSPLVTKFINGIMWGGKRSIAEKTFYNALKQVGEKANEEPLKVFKRAMLFRQEIDLFLLHGSVYFAQVLQP